MVSVPCSAATCGLLEPQLHLEGLKRRPSLLVLPADPSRRTPVIAAASAALALALTTRARRDVSGIFGRRGVLTAAQQRSPATAAEPAVSARSGMQIEGLKVIDLKVRLRARGLSIQGLKADLVTRLRGAEADDALQEDAIKSASDPIERSACKSSSSSSGSAADATPKVVDREAARGELRVLTVPQLKARLCEHGLPCGGLKVDLVNRLLEQEHGVEAATDRSSRSRSPWSFMRHVSDPYALPPEAVNTPRPLAVNLSGFDKVSTSTWLQGTIVAVMTFGSFVEVKPPKGGPPQWGMVLHENFQDDMDPSLDFKVGQELSVRLACLDYNSNRLAFFARRQLTDNEVD